MFSRRNLFKASAALSLGACASSQTSVTEETNGAISSPAPLDEVDFDLMTAADDPVFGDSSGVATVGTGNSRHDEVRTAFRLLWDTPRTDDHMEIARYFENLSTKNPNATNSSGQIASYNEEWVGTSNPLITSFFGMTSVKPYNGDQTFWCAAFVSFVLYAAGKPNMLSALSGAYRRYSAPTADPKVGDVVVFRKNGPEGDQGFGHVGFFVAQSDDYIQVLGGNQRGNSGSTGAVVTTRYEKYGSTLSYHSFRTVV